MTGAEMRDAVKARFPEAVISDTEGRDMHTLVVKKEAALEVSLFLRDDAGLDMGMLTDLTAVDWQRSKPEQFELVAMYWSPNKGHRLRIKFPIPADDLEFPSLIPAYKVANWLERELFDMFGIKAKGHPNLRRILTHQEFEGHPLRKEYPVNRRQPIRPAETDLLTLKPYRGKDAS